MVKHLIKGLALLLAALLLCGLFASCGKEEEEDVTSSITIHKAPDKGSNHLFTDSINELPATEELPSLSMQTDGPVQAGAASVTYRILNAGNENFAFGYADVLLQQKTDDGWVTYRRIDAVPEIGIVALAGGSATERVRPEQYGLTLKSGETYRILLENRPEVCAEFTVK